MGGWQHRGYMRHCGRSVSDVRFAACAVQGNLSTRLIDEIPRITTSSLVQAFVHSSG
jgi:hypothetical protein